MSKLVKAPQSLYLQLNSDKNSTIPYINLYIADVPLKRLFLELAFEMKPFWNSLPYTNIREFSAYMGRQSYTVFSAKIHQLLELDAICIHRNYLYVNPFLATKSSKIYDSVEELFTENGKYRIEEKIKTYITQLGGGI
jgi:hypothetical protein